MISGLTDAGLTEILTNPLLEGRAILHKGRPDDEEKPTRFAASVDPELFERVQRIRGERVTARAAAPTAGASTRSPG
jgi:hypothetical protein